MVLSISGNMQQNFNHLQGDHFNLLALDPLRTTTNASSIEGQSPTIGLTQVPAPPRDPSGSYGSIMLPPVTLAPVRTSSFEPYQPPPGLPKPGHLRQSLPNSVTSSPRLSHSSLLQKKWRHHGSQTSPREGDATPNLIVDPSTVSQAEKDLSRSKSCGKGRASSPPAMDFDTVLDKPEKKGVETCGKNICVSASPTPEAGDGIDGGTKEEFKCGALFLFLPGFGKAKPVRAKNKAEEYQPSPAELTQNNIVISRSVSLERFECGSWASSTIVAEPKNNNKEDGDSSTNLYFDLPLEMMQTPPMTAALVFENKERRGVLKSSSSTRAEASAWKSHESSRHVRFSSSTSPRSNPDSPSSCITPRLRKVRDDFSAFSEAQGA